MKRIKIIVTFCCSFILSVVILSCVVENSTAPKGCRQYDDTFGEYDIFKKEYKDNVTPNNPCDTGPDAGMVSFDGNSFVIEYRTDREQEIVVTYSATAAGK